VAKNITGKLFFTRLLVQPQGEVVFTLTNRLLCSSNTIMCKKKHNWKIIFYEAACTAAG